MNEKYLVDNMFPSMKHAYRCVEWIKEQILSYGFLTERQLKYDLFLLGMAKTGFGWEENDISSIRVEPKENSSYFKVTMNNPHKLNCLDD